MNAEDKGGLEKRKEERRKENCEQFILHLLIKAKAGSLVIRGREPQLIYPLIKL